MYRATYSTDISFDFRLECFLDSSGVRGCCSFTRKVDWLRMKMSFSFVNYPKINAFLPGMEDFECYKGLKGSLHKEILESGAAWLGVEERPCCLELFCLSRLKLKRTLILLRVGVKVKRAEIRKYKLLHKKAQKKLLF